MTDGPFTMLPMEGPRWSVCGPLGHFSDHTTEREAARYRKAANEVWIAAGGPRLLAERDEARALLKEAHDQFDYILSHVTEEPYPGMLSECKTRRDRIAAAIKETKP